MLLVDNESRNNYRNRNYDFGGKNEVETPQSRAGHIERTSNPSMVQLDVNFEPVGDLLDDNDVLLRESKLDGSRSLCESKLRESKTEGSRNDNKASMFSDYVRKNDFSKVTSQVAAVREESIFKPRLQ